MGGSDILPMTHAKYNDQLFRSAAFSDCTIKCQNQLWHLHRAILSPRCEFFWKCFDGPWEESCAVVSMHDDDPSTLDRLLRWIYTLEWPEHKSNYEGWTSDLMLYNMADKYGLDALMDEARQAMIRRAVMSSNTDRKEHSELFLRHLDDFVDTLDCLFQDPPALDDLQDLRRDILQIMAPMISKHMRAQQQLGDLLCSVPAFGVELVEALAALHDCKFQAFSAAVGGSQNLTGGESPRKVHIPLNEDSEDEFD